MSSRAFVHRREDGEGAREWAETAPARRLGPWITGYTGYREERGRPVQRLETPSGGAVMILSFGNVLTVSEPGFGARAVPGSAGVVVSFAGGMTEHPVLTSHDGRQYGVQVRLDPPVLYALFGTPLDELGRRPGGVTDLAELGVADWGERLGAASGWESRFELLDELLTAQLARRRASLAPEILHAWRRLRAAHGSVRIADLVAESGLSHRAFLGRFRRHAGVGPKVAARILRYERATALLDQGRLSVAAIAAASGYADQAHLDREFAALAGRSPTRLAEERAGSEYQSIRSILCKTDAEDGRTVAG
jgi:AraC-like DNA-binding protein